MFTSSIKIKTSVTKTLKNVLPGFFLTRSCCFVVGYDKCNN